jgi:hypothetical protein
MLSRQGCLWRHCTQLRRSAAPPLRRSAALAALALVALRADAADPPALNPEGTSTFGVRRVGDYPPRACWPTSQAPVRLAGPIWEGDTFIHPAQAWPGFPLVAQWAGSSATLAAPTFEEEDVGAAILPVGDSLRIGQLFGTTWWLSKRVEIRQSYPADLAAPWIAYAPDPETRALDVRRAAPGARISTLVGASQATVWNDDRSHRAAPLLVAPTSGQVITITQAFPNATASTTTTTLATPRTLIAPTIPWPPEDHAYAVAVAGVTPGSFVEVLDAANNVLGATLAGGPLVTVRVCPAIGPVRARVSRGAQVTTSPLVDRLPNPDVPMPAPATPTDTWMPFAPASLGQVPIRTWWPAGTPAAVVFVLHGQSPEEEYDEPGLGYEPVGPSQQDNFLGFSWLGERLASTGVAVVSVPFETNSVGYSVWYEQFVPAWYAAHPAAAEVPAILGGLSFGGGAALSAADSLAGGPVEILGAFGMSPNVDGVTLGADMPRLLILGEQDRVAFSQSLAEGIRPTRLYDTASGPISVVTIPGDIHNFFNTIWELSGYSLDIPHIESPAQRELTLRALERFVYAIAIAPNRDQALVAAWNGQTEPRGVASWRQRYTWRAGDRLNIDGFDSEPTTTNDLGGAITISNAGGSATETTVGQLPQQPWQFHATDEPVLRLQWTSAAFWYRSALNDLDAAEYDALTVDTMLIHDSTNPAFLPTDVWVVLRDTTGREAGVALGAGHDVDPPFTNDQFTPTTGAPRHQMETHTLPLTSFKAVNPLLDLQHLERFELRTNIVPTGDVVLDNLELRRW